MSCYIIAEAGLNHNGSIEIAKALIDSAADAGVDCVKFQKREVAILATGEILDAPDTRFPSLGATYRALREKHEFTLEQFRELKTYAEAKKLKFMVTPFDAPSVDFLESLGVAEYKLASHSVTNLPLLRYLAGKKKLVYLSTGMCTLDELDAAVSVFTSVRVPITIFHCVSVYPTPFEECNLKMIATLRERYRVPVGFSGHEIGWQPTLVAVGLGAVAVERHITIDKKMEGFDHKLSLEPTELAQMVREIRQTEKMLGDGQKSVSDRERVTRDKYHVSMVSVRPISAGSELTAEMVTWKNPGTGISYKDSTKVIGKKAARDIPADVLIDPSMFT